MLCEFGFVVDEKTGCEVCECAEVEVACAMDVQMCKDGTAVSRDPENDCEFTECPSILSFIFDNTLQYFCLYFNGETLHSG